MELQFNNTLKVNLDEYLEKYKDLFKKTLKTLNLKENYITSVTFVSKTVIKKINKEYRNIDSFTDVISFAFLDDKKEIIKSSNLPIDLGEIYICYTVAKENAKKYNNSINRELCFLFVHGLLHLLGYDHHTEDEEKIMFRLQDIILPPVEEKNG